MRSLEIIFITPKSKVLAHSFYLSIGKNQNLMFAVVLFVNQPESILPVFHFPVNTN